MPHYHPWQLGPKGLPESDPQRGWWMGGPLCDQLICNTHRSRLASGRFYPKGPTVDSHTGQVLKAGGSVSWLLADRLQTIGDRTQGLGSPITNSTKQSPLSVYKSVRAQIGSRGQGLGLGLGMCG